jgi:hypothetical protein
MKIKRRQLRRLIAESATGSSAVQKLARGFREAGDNKEFITQFFELAIALGHAKEGTLEIVEALGRPIVIMVASPELADVLDRVMRPATKIGYPRVNLGPDREFPDMRVVAYDT